MDRLDCFAYQENGTCTGCRDLEFCSILHPPDEIFPVMMELRNKRVRLITGDNRTLEGELKFMYDHPKDTWELGNTVGLGWYKNLDCSFVSKNVKWIKVTSRRITIKLRKGGQKWARFL